MNKKGFISICHLYCTILIASCGCKPQEIEHLDFLDNSGTTYLYGDTNQINPLKTKAVYYLINLEKYSCLNFDSIDSFVKNDDFIQKNIAIKYASLTAIFIKTSQHTKNLIKYRSNKMLALCSNDIVVEYEWKEDKLFSKSYLKEGQMSGTEKIKLLDMNDSMQK